MKRTLLSLIALALLAGCSGDDGDLGPRGTAGTTGEQGPAGANGADGQDATLGVSLSVVGRASLNAEDPEGAAEIVQYHTSTQTVYAINSAASVPTIEMMDISGLTTDVLAAPLTSTNLTSSAFTLETTANGTALGSPNSIAIAGDWMAVAMAADAHADNGAVLFYNGLDAGTPTYVTAVTVGNLPDMVTFTPDGSKLLVANEGEPSDDYTADPEGSIAVINIVDGAPEANATIIDFTAFNGQQAALEAQGMHFPNPSGRTINGVDINTTVAMDLEPEYIAASNDTAFVALQENNGLAIVDLTDNSVQVIGLGFKDWSGLMFDGMEDGSVSFGSYDNLFGMYQPDTIATYQWNGANFVVTANEGDAREYFFDVLDDEGKQNEFNCILAGGIDFDEDDGCLAYTDETQARRLNYTPGSALEAAAGDDPRDFDFTAFPLGRLNVTSEIGENDGSYQNIYAYGARSFTIWDQNGLVVFDSGDDFGRITASVHGSEFNNNDDANEGDSRSANKGSEPEALTIGQVRDRTYAFIGLERMGGIFVYDITNPYNTQFVEYVINRDTTEDLDVAAAGDLAPEGMTFISAEDSPNGNALLVVGNEISGTVTVWQVTPN